MCRADAQVGHPVGPVWLVRPLGYHHLRCVGGFPAFWPRASSGSAAVIMLLVVSVRRVPEMESGIRA